MRNPTPSKLSITGSLIIGVCLGVAAAQSSSFTTLAEQRATPSKMDWILVNTRIVILEQALRDQLSVPLVLTDYQFNTEEELFQIAVYADLGWLTKKGQPARDEAFKKRAVELCAAPMLARQPEYIAATLQTKKRPAESCSVRFWTHSMHESGQLTIRDVAIYEKGVLKNL